MKRFIKLVLGILLTLVLLVTTVGLSSAASTVVFKAVGVITKATIKVVPSSQDYQFDFTIVTPENKTYSFTNVYCPFGAMASQLTSNQLNQRYKVWLEQDVASGEWYCYNLAWVGDNIKVTDYASTSEIVPMVNVGMPASVEYNKNAIGSQAMITITWRDPSIAPLNITADAVTKYLTGETNTQAIMDRVCSQAQYLFEVWTPINQISAQDPIRATPPVLPANGRIQVSGNKTYFVLANIYFGIHIFALDNPNTPENELDFTTIIANAVFDNVPRSREAVLGTDGYWGNFTSQ